jgi:hypothetical protein
MSETRQRSERRFESRAALWSKRHRPRQFLNTPNGNALTTDYITYLADFLAGKLDDKPQDPPEFMLRPIQQLNDPLFLALATLAVLLDAIFRGWDGDDDSAAAKLKLKVGDDVYRRFREKGLAFRWGAGERVSTSSGRGDER